MREILEALDNLGEGEYGYIDAITGIDQTEIIFRVTGLPRIGGHHKRYKLASVLKGKPIGRAINGYTLGERYSILMACHENPELRDMKYKHYFDGVEETGEGYAEADKLYASFSRSLKLLFKHGLTEPSGWSGGMHRGARYRITEKSRELLKAAS